MIWLCDDVSPDDQPACTVDGRYVDSIRAYKDLQINCSVLYNGHRTPSIEWKFTDNWNRTSRFDHMRADVRNFDAGEHVTSLLNFTFLPSMNGSHFVCHPITGYQYSNDSLLESKRRFSVHDDPFALCQTLMIISGRFSQFLTFLGWSSRNDAFVTWILITVHIVAFLYFSI